MMMPQTIVTKTMMDSSRDDMYVTYRDEFPGGKKLTSVIQYLLLSKRGCVKSINIEYKENKL
jgi:hypothetical protein